MKIVAGLGNPGPKYETTRHNAGFLAIDRLIERWSARGPQHKNSGETFQATYGGEQILLVKPQTFMNLSGKCVGPLFNFYKCEPTDLIVIHDEVDLKPMQFRIKTGGGTAGHNGLKSMDEHLGSDKTGYHRVRFGVGKPSLLASGAKGMSTADYVLQQFTDSELKELDVMMDRVAVAVEMLVAGKITQAMNEFNRAAKEEEK